LINILTELSFCPTERRYIFPFPEELDEVMEEPMFYTAQGEQGKVNIKQQAWRI
jgi:hypothetical protein